MNGMYEELIEKLRKNNRMSGWTHIDRLIDEAAEAIEALQQENEQLKESLNDLQLYSLKMQNGEINMKVTGENAKIFVNSLIQFLKQNGGKNFVTTTGLIDDEKYEVTVRKCNGLTPGEKLTQLEQENEQLRAQAARVRAALTVANNYMPDIGQFCACGKCKTCGADINYAGYEHCVKCARVIIDAALSDTPADYHNPADAEALRKAREEVQNALDNYELVGEHEYDISEHLQIALAEIDKAIGGKEDA